MKQSQIVNAYKVLENMSKQTMPIKTAYAIHKLRGKLKPAFDFQAERETLLIEKLNPEIKDGRLFFKTVEDAKEWNTELAGIAEIDSDIEFEKITITMSDNINLTPNDIEALDGFVDFIE